MSITRIIGIIVLIAGLGLVGASFYIKHEVAEGRMEISSAQSKVDQANSLFSMSSKTKDVGKQLTAPAQSKIDAGEQQVGYYSDLAGSLQIWGIVLVVAGALMTLLGRKKHSHR